MQISSESKVKVMKEIAKAGGVSLSTCYRILRHPERALHPVQVRVRNMLVSNGYLREQQLPSDLELLCVIGRTDSYHRTALNFELQRLCTERGIGFTFCIHDQVEELLLRKSFHGLFLGTSPAPQAAYGLPAVAHGLGDASCNCSSIGFDYHRGLLQVFRELTRLGHRRIFYCAPSMLTPPRSNLRSPLSIAQLRECYTLNGLQPDESLFWLHPLASCTHYHDLSLAADAFLALRPRPTAIVLAGDIYAPVFYQRLQDAGLQIPRDVSITGADNLHRFANFVSDSDCIMLEACKLTPPLTTIDFPLREFALTALDTLLAKIDDPTRANRTIVIQPDLVLTDSIGPAPSQICQP